jgi:hypothetical protein
MGFCSAHAGYAPWDGVNALDAAFVAYAGISALRQQIRPEQRVHGVISGRDWTPNGSSVFVHHHHHARSLLPLPPAFKKTKGERETYKQAILIFFFGSYPRLRQNDVVRPRGRVGCARAAARARGELPRVRAHLFSFG